MLWKRKSRQLDEFGRSPLHYAARDGDVGAAQAHVASGADVNAADANGWTALHFAAQSQSAATVSLLLDKGATVDTPDRHGNTPLFRAVFAYQGNPGTIEALRAAGADPLKKNAHGVSPASLARSIANYDVAKCFADLPGDAADTA